MIAPVGFEIDRVVKPAKGIKDKKTGGWIIQKAEKVYLLVHSDPKKDKAKQYAAEIIKQLTASKIDTKRVHVDWDDIEKITKTARNLILKEFKDNPKNQISINLASGSKNHAIGLDRACMTLRERGNLIPFYSEAVKWEAHNLPPLTQLTTGVKKIKFVETHRIIVPEQILVEALGIIHNNSKKIPYNPELIGIEKQDLANKMNMTLVQLQRNITQKLVQPWQAIFTKKEGRKYYVGLTNEGKYLQYILENPETSGSS